MLMGNITRDPILRRTPKGTSVTDVGLAVNRYYTLDDGQKREDTTFVDITLWGRQAEIVCDYCQKGRPLYVEGRLQLDTWEDKNTGQQRSRLKVIGENIQLLGSRDGGGGGGGGYSQSASPAQEAPDDSASSGGSYDPPPQQQQQEQQGSSSPPSGAMGPVPDEEEDDIPF